ncbi:MAG: hypothetical protein IPG18_07740 [Saprospiraceae bacterium]|nr:hypothetical protein [Saprospiraceae bacterium]
MKSIKFASLARYRAGEFIQFMTTVTDLYQKFEHKSPHLDNRIRELQDKVQVMQTFFMENKKESLNKKLKPFDRRRMNTLRGLKTYLDSEIYREHPDRFNHAKTLLTSYYQYCTRIRKLSLQHKTAIISKMMAAWTSEPNLIESLNALDANYWITELIERNEMFYSHYFDKTRTRVNVVNSQILKEGIREVYDKLIMDINALAWIASGNNVYEPLIRELNNIIEINNQPVRNRNIKRRKDAPVISSCRRIYLRNRIKMFDF